MCLKPAHSSRQIYFKLDTHPHASIKLDTKCLAAWPTENLFEFHFFFSISIFYGKIIFNCGYNLYYLNLMLLEHKSATLPAAVLHKLPLLFLCVFFKIAKFLWLFNMTEHYIFGKLLYFFVTKMLLSLINLSIYKILFQLKKYPENFEWSEHVKQWSYPRY